MAPREEPDVAAMSDEALALALQEGASAAFEEIVRRHQGRVYAVAYRVTGNREDALDVAQEALFKVYRRIHAWRPTSGFLPWLLRLTVNQGIDHVRRRKRHRHRLYQEGLAAEGSGVPVEPAGASTEREVRAREIDHRVHEALAVLSPAQQTVFVMRHYEGLQLAEIARVMGCTVGSVKVHLFRALKKLQRELADLLDTEQAPGRSKT